MKSKLLYQRLNKMRESLELVPYVKGENRLCAIILDAKGVPISIGYNSYTKTHPIMRNFAKKDLTFPDGSKGDEKIYLHAEMDCYTKGYFQKHRWHTMIITRIDCNGNFKLAKPCVGCYNMIKDKFDNIYYTNNNGELILLDTNKEITNNERTN